MNESLEIIVTNIRLAARDTNLYTLERPDGGELPSATAGSHINLHLPNGLERQYSLVEADERPHSYIVGIKRDLGSRGGSTWIHEELRVGMRLLIEAPSNNFPLKEDADMTVLFAGGIGVTPIYCMARRLESLGRKYEVHYSCRSRADAVFLKEFADRPNVYLHFDDEAQSFMPIAALVATAPKGAHLYCCGPAPMLAAFEAAAAAAGRPTDEVHVEYFSAKFEAAKQGGYVVNLAKAGREITIPPGKSILQALIDSGINVPRSCEEGVCGACETTVLSGLPDHRDSILTEAERQASKTMMICCSGARSDRLVLDI